MRAKPKFDVREDPDALLEPADAATLLSISEMTLARLVRRGVLKPPLEIGKLTLRYRRRDVLDYLDGLEAKAAAAQQARAGKVGSKPNRKTRRQTA